MGRTHIELLGHVGHHIGLADGLAARDRQSLVSVGAARKSGLDKIFTRHLVHRPQDGLICNTPPTQGQQKLHMIITLMTARSFRHV